LADIFITDALIQKDLFQVKYRYADPANPGNWRDETVTWPLATLTKAGLMSGTDKEVLAGLVIDVASIQGRNFRLNAHTFTFDEFSTDSAVKDAQEAELTNYALSELGFSDIASIPNGTAVHNVNGDHLFRFNQNGAASYWVDDGFDVVGLATTTTAGVVKGSDSAAGGGYVEVLNNGVMKVLGWEDKEDKTNKSTLIPATGATNDNYPSEKAVADALAGKEATANKSQALNDASTHTQYPTAKAVYDALLGKEDLSNKAVSSAGDLTNASTDAQYPSAKVVYLALLAKENLTNKVASTSSTLANGALTAAATDDQYPSALVVFQTVRAMTIYNGQFGQLLTGSNVVDFDETPQNPRAQDYPKWALYTVPEYVVGENQLDIYHNGLHCTINRQYQEVGVVGSKSTQIKLMHPVIMRDEYDVYVRPRL
jgi:hypothetical protein